MLTQCHYYHDMTTCWHIAINMIKCWHFAIHLMKVVHCHTHDPLSFVDIKNIEKKGRFEEQGILSPLIWVCKCMYFIHFGLFLKETNLDIERWDYNVCISTKITKLMGPDLDSYFWLICRTGLCDLLPIGNLIQDHVPVAGHIQSITEAFNLSLLLY